MAIAVATALHSSASLEGCTQHHCQSQMTGQDRLAQVMLSMASQTGVRALCTIKAESLERDGSMHQKRPGIMSHSAEGRPLLLISQLPGSCQGRMPCRCAAV